MPAPRNLRNPGSYKEDIGQKWITNSYQKTISDQFGFVIHYGNAYRLEYRGEKIRTVYSVPAAKMISTIILNDIVMNKSIAE